MKLNRQAARMMLGFAFLLCALSAGAQDAFEAEQRAAAAKNPPGVTCTLRLPQDKTSFHQGEIIPFEVQFSSNRPGTYRLNRYIQGRPSMLEFGTFRVSPKHGASDPLSDLPAPSGMMIDGYVPVPLALTDNPTSVSVELNDFIRFDQPGTYRVYAVNRRILPVKTSNTSGSTFGPAGMFGRIPAVSNIIQLTILPPDEAWNRAQVQATMAVLAQFDGKYMDDLEASPAHVLRALGTPEAARAMIERIGKDERPRSAPVESQEYYTGLIGFKDRDWLIKEMERALERPDYAVTQPFLSDLSLLSGVHGAGTTPADRPASSAAKSQNAAARLEGTVNKRLRLYWLQTADVVPLKTGRAKAMTLDTLLELAWLDWSIGRDPVALNRVPQLRKELVSVFDELPPTPQEYMLGDLWQRIRQPELLPSLRRLWKRLGPPLYGNPPELANLVLRRFDDLSPTEGKQIILEQIASSRPKVNIEALKVLPAETLPSVDAMLAAKLKNQDTRNELTADLVERYATGAIFPTVRAFYQEYDDWDYDINVALLAYLLRVNPDYGERALEKRLAQGKGGYTELWTDLARRRWDSRLERLATMHLNNLSPQELANAARMLGEYGSPAAKGALLARLRRHDEDLQSRQIVENSLVEALANGKGWLMDAQQLKALRSLCVTPSGQSVADEYIRSRVPSKVHVDYELGDRGYWNIAHYTGQGLASMEAKLAQYPRGTVFEWQPTSFGQDERKLFKKVQTLVQARGMRIERMRPFGIGY